MPKPKLKPKRDIKPRAPLDLGPNYSLSKGDDDDDLAPVAKKPVTPAAAAAAEEDDYFDGAAEEPKELNNWLEAAAETVTLGEAAKQSALISKIVEYADERQLTKKDRSKLEIWHGRTRGKQLDGFFGKLAEGARKEFGHRSVYLGSESKSLIVTIPMFGGHGPLRDVIRYPGCLPMEFIMALDGFPLGLIVQLVAKPGVGKSALSAEFGRWFFLAGGGFSLKEAEHKFNPQWYQSILGTPFFEMMPLYRCDSIEDWQRKLTFAIKTSKRELIGNKEHPGPGRTVPILFGVDSIMGKQCEETQEVMLGKKNQKGERGSTGTGHGQRGHPLEAMVITRYMRTVPDLLDNWPFSLILVNHLRIGKDEMGHDERVKTGGDQVVFQESWELELKKTGGHKKKIQCAEYEGFPVQISVEKNSFGPTHRSIQTRVLWWEVQNPATGEWEQQTVWDWDWSTVHLLSKILGGENVNPRLKQNLKDMDFHLETPSTAEIENTAWSKTLGMTKDDVMSWSEVGALIRRDQKLMAELRKALRIVSRPVLRGDYIDQIEQMTEALP